MESIGRREGGGGERQQRRSRIVRRHVVLVKSYGSKSALRFQRSLDNPQCTIQRRHTIFRMQNVAVRYLCQIPDREDAITTSPPRSPSANRHPVDMELC